MTSSCQKRIFCYLHMDGRLITKHDGTFDYVGGRSNGIMLNEGMMLNEFIDMLKEKFNIYGTGNLLKYTLKFDKNMLMDLYDNMGFQNLLEYNDTTSNIYIVNEDVQNIELQKFTDQHVDRYHSLSTGSTVLESPTFQGTGECMSLSAQVIGEGRLLNASSQWMNEITHKGQIFEDANSFREALFKFSIANQFEYRFIKNNKNKVIAGCAVLGCDWRVTTNAVKSTSFLAIGTFRNIHSHSAQDLIISKPRITAKLTASLIDAKLRSAPDTTSREICADLFNNHELRLTYHQAWHTKEQTLQRIRGKDENSYKLIPWLCNRLKEVDPRTVAIWESTQNNCFSKLFVAYGCSVEGFLGGCRPILYIDGCHLSGPYKGCLLSASSHDADNCLFPVAYAIVLSENNEDWLWFLRKLKNITGDKQVIIVSDRHQSIITGVSQVFGHENHAYCYRHVKENFSSAANKFLSGQRKGKEHALKLLDAVVYARLDVDYINALEELKKFGGQQFNLAQWVVENEPDHWVMSQFPHKQWDMIMTNIAESFNAWIVKERRHNITSLIREHHDKLAVKLCNAQNAINMWRNGIGPNIENKLVDQIKRSHGLAVTSYGNSMFKVRVENVDVSVNLERHECACRSWKMSGIPCAHACAVIRAKSFNIYEYVDDCYKVDAQRKIYASTMVPMNTHDMPDCNSLDVGPETIILLPPRTSRPPGRPPTKRKESQFMEKSLSKCTRCHQLGHNRRTCKNPNPHFDLGGKSQSL